MLISIYLSFSRTPPVLYVSAHGALLVTPPRQSERLHFSFFPILLVRHTSSNSKRNKHTYNIICACRMSCADICRITMCIEICTKTRENTANSKTMAMRRTENWSQTKEIAPCHATEWLFIENCKTPSDANQYETCRSHFDCRRQSQCVRCTLGWYGNSSSRTAT